jgi:hypothetical protein
VSIGTAARVAAVAGIAGIAGALAGCGDSGPAAAPSGTLDHSGRWWRAQPAHERARVAAACRSAASARARSEAAGEQLRSIDVDELRAAIDDAYTIIPAQSRPIAAVCRDVVPFHTPGGAVRFAGARDGGDGTWSVPAISTRPYVIRGRVAPARAGRVTARRMDGYSVAGRVAPDGSFRLRVRFRHVADNTFTVTVDTPPAAVHRVLFTAICLDCLAGGAPPPAASSER